VCRVKYDRLVCLGNMARSIESKCLVLVGSILDILGWAGTIEEAQ
jgi:hypothetical protein